MQKDLQHEAANRAIWDAWLAKTLDTPAAKALAALGGGYLFSCKPKRLEPRGTWKKLRRCRCR